MRQSIERVASLHLAGQGAEQDAGFTQKTAAQKMIGFRGFGARVNPTLLVRITACFDYGPNQGTNQTLVPTVTFWYDSQVKPEEKAWLKRLEAATKPILEAAMDEEGMHPTNARGYTVEPSCTGMAEIGEFSVAGSWVDNHYIAVRADTHEIAQLLKQAISKALPLANGNSRGTGWQTERSPGELVYNWTTNSIGD